MSNEVFPTLPGQTWPRTKIINTTATVRRANGRRYAITGQMYPTYTYRLAYAYLREADYTTLAAFFLRHGGRLDDWLFDDRDDRSATDQAIGVADGVNRTFQLVRTWSGAVDPVDAVNGTPAIKLDGVTQAASAYTLSGGLVIFTVAPPAGTVVSWTGLYYWRAAFTKGEAEFQEFMRRLRSMGQIEFETFRP